MIMKNCIVKMFQKDAENNALPIYGTIVLDIVEMANPSNNTQWFNLIANSGGSIDAEIIGDGQFLKGSSYASATGVGKILKEVTNMSTDPYYYFSNGNYKVLITGKYDINVLTSAKCIKSINLNELLYSTITTFNNRDGAIEGNLKALKNVNDISFFLASDLYKNLYGDLKDIMTSTRTGIHLYSNSYGDGKITGNLSDVLVSKDTLTQFDIGGNAGITGDIAVLGQCTSLTHLYCFVGCNTYGTIESMIAAFRSNGRTSGSIATQVYDTFGRCAVTFNGQPIPSSYETQELSWTATTITCNGVTIEA